VLTFFPLFSKTSSKFLPFKARLLSASQIFFFRKETVVNPTFFSKAQFFWTPPSFSPPSFSSPVKPDVFFSESARSQLRPFFFFLPLSIRGLEGRGSSPKQRAPVPPPPAFVDEYCSPFRACYFFVGTSHLVPKLCCKSPFRHGPVLCWSLEGALAFPLSISTKSLSVAGHPILI